MGRDPHLVLREVAPGRRLLVLSADEKTPATIARLLTEHGAGASRLTVLGDLGGPTESSTSGCASGWQADSPRLNVVAVEVDGPGWGWTAGLPDEAYEHDGQLTKRDLRASALARLAPRPGELLWDVGAGAGSVGIEWMRSHPTCRTVAVEADATRAERIGRNAESTGRAHAGRGARIGTGRAHRTARRRTQCSSEVASPPSCWRPAEPRCHVAAGWWRTE